MAWWQLLYAGATVDQAKSAVRRGLLTPIIPKVYAWGAPVVHPFAHVWEAVLYAGPGAMLSHGSAAHHRGLINFPPGRVHVSTPRRIASRPGIAVHARRDLDRAIVDGIPVTTVPQTVLDLAAQHPDNDRIVRHALAQLDYRGLYDAAALSAASGRGVPGSRALRAAMALHDPNLARLNSPLEEDLYGLLRAWRIAPLPELNVEVLPGITVDAYFRDVRTALETDGHANHHTPAQRHRDHRRDLALRGAEIAVVRYDRALLHGHSAAVYDDLMATLSRQAALLGVPAPTGVRPG